MKKTIAIKGMSCAHCQNFVKETLLEIDGVQDAEVSLSKQSALVTLSKDVPDQTLIDAISEAGYEPIGVAPQP